MLCTKRWFPVVVLAFGVVASPAWADLIDPSASACSGAEEGDACTIVQEDEDAETTLEGTCQASECCFEDYTDSEDGSPTGTVCNDCFTCEITAGGQTGTATDDSGGCAAGAVP